MSKLPIEITMTSLPKILQMHMSAMQCILPAYPTRYVTASNLLKKYGMVMVFLPPSTNA
jgi:hypothetical protein